MFYIIEKRKRGYKRMKEKIKDLFIIVTVSGIILFYESIFFKILYERSPAVTLRHKGNVIEYRIKKEGR
jgi:hypothetical protein